MRRHLLIIAAGGLLLAAGPLACTRAPHRTSERAVRPMDAALFHRDQPATGQVLAWDGQVVVQADQFYSLDLDRAVATPLRLPGVRQVLGLATRGPGQALALCSDDGGLCLLAREGGKWSHRELPAEARKAAKPPLLCADSLSVVLLGEDELFRLAGPTWERVPLQAKPRRAFGLDGGPAHALLTGGKLYLGYDQGEWGGGLLSVDVGSGDWSKVKLGHDPWLPIRDVRAGPGGKVWVVQGLAHLSLAEGAVYNYDGTAWKTLCDSSPGQLSNWNLPPAALDALAFDGDGRPYVLSGSLGVVRYDGERWVRLTPGWPAYVYCSSLHITPAGVAVIGMSDAGVLLFDLQSRRARRVTFRK